MSKILIVGGAGYIGSHVNKRLTQAGYETVVFDNLIHGHRQAVKWGELIVGDLANSNDIEKVFATNDIEAVFHFAAFAYVGESIYDPEKYYFNNVCNTLNLLRVMRRYNCDKIIFSSTCATYGIPEHLPIIEDCVQQPINPYGKTKLVVEGILKDYARAYGIRSIALRYFNSAGADPECEIGESHNPETHIIPLILKQALTGTQALKVFGTDYDTVDGSCVRDYIHVTDLADAHIKAYEYLKRNDMVSYEYFNLGNATGTSVLELIQVAKEVTGKDIQFTVCDRREGDPAILVGGSQKARTVLGWNPMYEDIRTIILHAWNWHCQQSY